ncbi:MAG: cytochrome c [Campylobacterales bacterium]|nr:cytochrome c [Campylobacterales bacterium]
MKVLLTLFIALQVYGATSFITKEEYAAGLYHNPRGIGCQMCHGELGEGRKIATYKEEGERKVFQGSPINHTAFADFYHRVNSKIIGMPRYYLTDTEIQTLYYYLHREEFRRAASKHIKSK